MKQTGHSQFCTFQKLFCSSRGNSWFKHGSVIVNNISAYFTLSLSAAQVFMIKERCWFSPYQLLYWVLSHIGSRFCFFPANFMSSTYTDENNPFSRCTNKHSQLETFSQPYFKSTSSNCLSHTQSCQWVSKNFRSSCTTGSGIFLMILAICVVEDVPYVWTFCSRNFDQSGEHPSILHEYKADTASAACPSQSAYLAITSITFATVIWDADEPCSV